MRPSRDHDQLVNEHSAVQRLGLQVKTLRRWRWAGRGPIYHKLGAAVRYSPAISPNLFWLGGARARRTRGQP